MQELADELYESWINGNLSAVIEHVCSERNQARAALLAALLATAMSAYDRMVFFRMLKDKVNES